MTDPNGAAIYGVPWIPSIYPQSMLALIYQHHGSVMGMILYTDENKKNKYESKN